MGNSFFQTIWLFSFYLNSKYGDDNRTDFSTKETDQQNFA